MRACWCGDTELALFSSEYAQCQKCGTLVSQKVLPENQFTVSDDETDFYGKQYWLKHQDQDFGFPDIYKRSRNDMIERNLHWLRVLLKYALPPAQVLEVGCGHGSFVALMQQAGYKATGVELSPWVVDYARKTFNIDVRMGPVESLGFSHGSFDVIVLMDVLEHLSDPVAMISHCINLLKDNGFLLIQTPKFKEQLSHNDLIDQGDLFLEMLIPDEHIYLFSERSAKALFKLLGAEYVYFEPAIFSHYDMFFVVSQMPLVMHEIEEIETTLLANPNGRFALALLDLQASCIAKDERLAELTAWVQEREARLVDLDRQVRELNALLRDSEADGLERGRQISELTAWLQEAQADRQARGQQVLELTAWVQERESRLAELDRQVRELNALLRDSEADGLERGRQISELTAWLQEAQADRQARGQQVLELTAWVQEREARLAELDRQVRELNALLRDSEADGLERGRQISELTAWLQEAQADRQARDI